MNKGKKITRRIGWRMTAIGLCLSLLTGIVVSQGAKAQTQERETRSISPLSKYTLDVTAEAAQGHFNSIDESANNTDRAIQILCSQQKNNPVVVSDSQAVRDMVIVGVAVRIARGDVPEELKSTRLYKLNLTALFNDSKNADDLVSRISAILSDLSNHDARAILIIDPIQSLIGPSS